ncbi:MAG: PilZ domain-containing protein [Gammaproteobacteria bacterium]|nr:MAG: PilZ domain-containing protein [Gammaproteobacteria bacterium]
MNEKRHFTRVQFDASAVIKTAEGIWDTKVIDLSLKGALIEKPDTAFVNNEPIELKLTLSDSRTEIIMQGRIAHTSNNHIGMVCEHIDVDSISHLRRIVELNTGQQELLERELEAFTIFTDRDSFHELDEQ